MDLNAIFVESDCLASAPISHAQRCISLTSANAVREASNAQNRPARTHIAHNGLKVQCARRGVQVRNKPQAVCGST